MEIEHSDFAKLDLRVGKILSVNAHPNADKLLVLAVDLGEGERRTIVAGLKGHYEKEELEGKSAIFVFNLKPAMLRGVESKGMILAAVSDDKKTVRILEVDGAMKPGTKVS